MRDQTQTSSSSQAPAIRFDRVVRQFGSQRALDNVTYEVPHGVVFALLGENGAGKTTSIKSILGMREPDAGSVSVLGMNPVKHSYEIRRQVGYVPEQASLYDWMTVAEAGWFAAGFYPDGYQAEYTRLAEGFDLPLTQKIKKSIERHESQSRAVARDGSQTAALDLGRANVRPGYTRSPRIPREHGRYDGRRANCFSLESSDS